MTVVYSSATRTNLFKTSGSRADQPPFRYHMQNPGKVDGAVAEAAKRLRAEVCPLGWGSGFCPRSGYWFPAVVRLVLRFITRVYR